MLLSDLYNTDINLKIYSLEIAILRRIAIILSQKKLGDRRVKNCNEAFRIYPMKAYLKELTLPVTSVTLKAMGSPLVNYGNGSFHEEAKGAGNMNIILTEEHDEVLYQWMVLKEKKKINNNNIIIHLDAHSDMNLIEEEYMKEMLPENNLTFLRKNFSCFYEEEKYKREITFPINMTNYLHYAVKKNLAKEIFWVMPDPDFCKLRLAANFKKTFLLNIEFGENFRLENRHIVCNWQGIKIHILRLCDLPEFNESVLLDIDTDYFINEDSGSDEYGWHGYRIKDKKELEYWSGICNKKLDIDDIKPWITIDNFYNLLIEKKIKTPVTTVSLSPFYTQGEYHILPFKVAEKLGIIIDKP